MTTTCNNHRPTTSWGKYTNHRYQHGSNNTTEEFSVIGSKIIAKLKRKLIAIPHNKDQTQNRNKLTTTETRSYNEQGRSFIWLAKPSLSILLLVKHIYCLAPNICNVSSQGSDQNKLTWSDETKQILNSSTTRAIATHSCNTVGQAKSKQKAPTHRWNFPFNGIMHTLGILHASLTLFWVITKAEVRAKCWPLRFIKTPSVLGCCLLWAKIPLLLCDCLVSFTLLVFFVVVPCFLV